MALFKFTKAILEGKPIQVFNHGKMIRDFTYIDDIVEGVVRVLDTPARPDGMVILPIRPGVTRPTESSISGTIGRWN